MNSDENPQSKRKHQRATHDQAAMIPADKQDRGGNTPRHASDATRASNRSPSQVESRSDSRGSR
jgi:hypothetical protein